MTRQNYPDDFSNSFFHSIQLIFIMRDQFFEFAGELPEHRPELPIFRTLPEDALTGPGSAFYAQKQEQLHHLQNHFGLQEEVSDMGDHFLVRNEQYALEVYLPSDSSWWTDRELAYSTDEKLAEDLPDEGTCFERAESLLDELGVDRQYLRFRGAGHNWAKHAGAEGPEPEEFRTNTWLNYGYEVADVPVFGPGGKLSLSFVGKDAQPIEYLNFFRRPRAEEGTAQIIAPEEALDLFTGHASFAKVRENPEATACINSMELGYFSLGPSHYQKYLIPAYKISAHMDAPAHPDHGFSMYVVAVRMTNEEMKARQVLDRPFVPKVFT
ncbi:MAG: hypothetical protein AAF570_24600 [Bacteroidota bacterium]